MLVTLLVCFFGDQLDHLGSFNTLLHSRLPGASRLHFPALLLQLVVESACDVHFLLL